MVIPLQDLNFGQLVQIFILDEKLWLIEREIINREVIEVKQGRNRGEIEVEWWVECVWNSIITGVNYGLNRGGEV